MPDVEYGSMPRVNPDPIAAEANGHNERVHIPTRAEARKRRKLEQEQGFKYPLPYTGGVAHVRLPSLATITTHVGLPADAQALVLRVFRENAAEGEQTGAGAALTWERLSKNQGRSVLLANAMVCIGFQSPRVVMTDAELDPGDEHMLTVDDLHIDERLGFLRLCLGQSKEEAAKLEPFPATGLRLVETLPADASDGRATVEATQATQSWA